ncbi:MAG: DUF115 domain-containing protein [Spirochaetaceae bacterium]|nr:DUF115 domain-containing protein [Spirochaetaceae bacterium]
MCNLAFLVAKSGITTCTVNNIHLHSKYDPEKEGVRFAESIQADFIPKVIVIIEPGLSYCLAQLKELFPMVKLVALRFTDVFNDYNNGWDLVVNYKNIDSLLYTLGEDIILSTLFVNWPPSVKAFPKETEFTWNIIKKLVKNATDILATRSFFGIRWIKNSIKFCLNCNNNKTIKKGSGAVLIAASGPSLESSLDNIKKYRSSFFLIALSSAYSVLKNAQIEPDLCISTDGGYWAKKHLEKCSSPLVLSAESAIPTRLLKTSPIIPIRYGDGIESFLLDKCGFFTIPGKRNGTVSGTAAELAFEITSGPIFACGLDLSINPKGKQHSRPNRLEALNEIKDYRLKTLEQRHYPGQLSSPSLAIYENWFIKRDKNFGNRFFRLSHSSWKYSNKLGNISDITWQDFCGIISKMSEKKLLDMPKITCCNTLPDVSTRLNSIKKIINEISIIDQQWISSLIPAEYLTYTRSIEKKSQLENIKVKLNEKIKIINDFLYDMEKSI